MKETVINVKGMVCNGCENRVKNALKNINGIETVVADHNTGKIVVTSNEDVLENTMTETLEGIGFEVIKED